MEEWSLIMQVMTHLLNILNHQRQICMTTMRPTMLKNTPHHHKQWIPCLVHQSMLWPLTHLRRILHHTFSGRRRQPPMNSMSSSSFLKRILTLAIQSIGGWAIVLNSPTCFGLLMTFFAYLVPYCVTLKGFAANVIVLGSAVAVEQVFLGGHDTISLWWASLQPETIKVLMLVKKKLHLMRAQSTAALHHWLQYCRTLYSILYTIIFPSAIIWLYRYLYHTVRGSGN